MTTPEEEKVQTKKGEEKVKGKEGRKHGRCRDEKEGRKDGVRMKGDGGRWRR